MGDWRRDRIGSAHRGENPTVLARLPGGFAVMGDVQWLPGYCVLLTDDPLAGRLSDLSRSQRRAFLDSMALLAQAVERACAAVDAGFRRVNVEILGNTDPYLHAHVWPLRLGARPSRPATGLALSGRQMAGRGHRFGRAARPPSVSHPCPPGRRARRRVSPRPGVAARSRSLPKRSH